MGITEDSLQPIEAQKVADHDYLMLEIKEKLCNATKVQQYQPPSLVPTRMSVREGAKFFGLQIEPK